MTWTKSWNTRVRAVRLGSALWLIAVASGCLEWKTRGLLAEAEGLASIDVAPHPGASAIAAAAESRSNRLSKGVVRRPSVLRSGENLGQVLARLGLNGPETVEVVEALRPHVDPRRMRPGSSYTAFVKPSGELEAFELAVMDRGVVSTRRTSSSDGWQTTWRAFPRRRELGVLTGELKGSLETSLRIAGGDPALAYPMADALQWDLDFSRDLREGDRFRVVYEELFVDERYSGIAAVLAIAYATRGKTLEVYRFGPEGGFYDAQGRPLQKMFLRSPLKYSRVTSRFSLNRFHPVLKVHRPHYGVDYGAPVGTPVRATAGGTVVSAGWAGGGGKTVKLRHPNDFVTHYLHLSRFAEGVRPGRRVEQGDVVGYVGSTGLSTAPHLDYRVQHRGRWIDPLTLKSVPAEPISVQQLPDFLEWRDALRQGMDTGRLPGRLMRAVLNGGSSAEPSPQTLSQPSRPTAVAR